MKIVIDGRMYGLEHAGIGRYLANLIREIKNQSASWRTKIKNTEIFLLIRKKHYQEIKKETGNRFRLIIADYPHYSLKEQIFLPLQLIKLRPDLVHFPHFNVPIFWWGKYVVTIHDLIKHESKGMATTTRSPFIYWLKHVLYLLIIRLAVKRAARIITPSNWWKKELIKRYRLPKNKIVVTYEGVDENLLPQTSSKLAKPVIKPQAILSKYKIKKPFLVYTGSLYPHKNVERLMMAVKKINQNLSLVIICARNIFYERFRKKVKQMGVERYINLVGFVPDEELVEIYQQAEAFVFPSLLEGFGLPGLETMAVGLPVVSSNSSCLPEVYGDAALYFDPLNIKDMAEKILMVIRDKEIRDTLIKKGFEQVKKYSWQKMAKQTLAIYLQALTRTEVRYYNYR